MSRRCQVAFNGVLRLLSLLQVYVLKEILMEIFTYDVLIFSFSEMKVSSDLDCNPNVFRRHCRNAVHMTTKKTFIPGHYQAAYDLQCLEHRG